MPIATVLVANRGEIALRVIRTLRTRGITSVAVYHAVDADAPHVRAADRAVELPARDARAAYLDIDAIVAAALEAKADAIHPGYGFLSEQSRFAKAVEAAGLVFIGPRPETLEALGDKKRARQAAREAGLPVAPGWEGDATSPEALHEAKQLGFPLLLKAVMGGGGKGMRVVRGEGELADALQGTAREALASFGDAAVYMERLLEDVRHVEVQFVGDGAGGVAHLFERECSLQRRHQKVIEEAPAARMNDKLRRKLTDAAKAIAQHVKYRGAGTAEFLVDGKENVYFLEVNARLQVEHPVTELVTGVDLVGVQLDVAEGRGLPKDLERAHPHGHAIEARLYAEDGNFLPQSGRIAALELPGGAGVRVDCGVREGDTIGMDFDPMIAKISVWGADRAEAVARFRAALAETLVAGVVTNLPFLRALANDPHFADGRVTTSLVESTIAPAWRAQRKSSKPDPVLEELTKIVLAEGRASARGGERQWHEHGRSPGPVVDARGIPPVSAHRWGPGGRLTLEHEGRVIEAVVIKLQAGRYEVWLDGERHLVEAERRKHGGGSNESEDALVAPMPAKVVASPSRRATWSRTGRRSSCSSR
jgi:acetyl/propionyl-CoA carboxylase alpha subunit